MGNEILAYGFSEGEDKEIVWNANVKFSDNISHKHNFYASFGHCINNGKEYFFAIVYGSRKKIMKKLLTSFFVEKVPGILLKHFGKEFELVNVYSLSVNIIDENRNKQRTNYNELFQDTSFILTTKFNFLRNELFS